MLEVVPWLTLGASTLVVVAWFWPGAFEALAYDRGKILNGQLWRIVTSHWVHFSASHLFWNLVVLVPAGAWLEQRNAHAVGWTLLLSPFAIGLSLLAFLPTLGTYAGISGWVRPAGGAGRARPAGPAARWLWLALLVLFAAKVGVESFLAAGRCAPALAAKAWLASLSPVVGAIVGVGVRVGSAQALGHIFKSQVLLPLENVGGSLCPDFTGIITLCRGPKAPPTLETPSIVVL